MSKDIQKIEWVDINKIKEWVSNPKHFSKETIIALAEKIKHHGFKSPLIVWSKNGQVYKGNTTLKAAKVLGLKKVPVAYTEFKDENAAIAYGVADNQQSDLAEWDEKALVSLLSKKEMLKNQTGFSEADLERMRKKFDKKEEEDEDSIFSKTVIVFYQSSDKDKFLPEIKKLAWKYKNVQIH